MEKGVWTIIFLVIFILLVLIAVPGKIQTFFHNEILLIFSALAIFLILFLILLKNKE